MLAVVLPLVSARAEEIVLQPGDVVEMSVVGAPELTRRAMVEAGGSVSLPIFGEVGAKGRTLDDLRADLRGRLPGISYRRQATDGTDRFVDIQSGDLLIDLSQARPIYVSGDVALPGERPYAPGLTVRQLVALAGGLDVMRLRKTDPFLESEDLRVDYTALWTDYATQTATVARIEAELDGKRRIGELDLARTPVSTTLVQQIATAQEQQLALSLDTHERNKTRLDTSIVQSQDQIEGLLERKRIEDQEIAEARQELTTVQGMLSRGLIQNPRVTEARRTLLLSSAMSLETQVEILKTQNQRENLVAERGNSEDERRSRLIGQLDAARLALEGIRSKLQAVGGKLLYTNVIRSQLVRGDGAEPEVSLRRRDAEGATRLVPADLDTELQPGDVVEIALKLGSEPDAVGIR